MKDGTFDIQLPLRRKYSGCRFSAGRYRTNGNLYLSIHAGSGILYVCTANPDEKLPDDVICVKDYAENEGMADWLKSRGLIGDRVNVVRSGWVELGVYELTEPGKALFSEVEDA